MSDMRENFLERTAEIVSAYLSNNQMDQKKIPELIKTVYKSLVDADSNYTYSEGEKPAVSIEDSVKDNYIICLEDGKKLKMLKRYLKTNYNMSPEEYKKKWNLPKDYPFVAPAYAKKRSELAKKTGFGKKSS